MNKHILKNPLRQHIKTIFRGREKLFKSKESKAFDFDDEEQRAEYFHWVQTFDFLYDITANMPNSGGDKNDL
jgi:hypothetical protein